MRYWPKCAPSGQNEQPVSVQLSLPSNRVRLPAPRLGRAGHLPRRGARRRCRGRAVTRQRGPASCARKATRYPAGQDEAPAGWQTAEAKEQQCENVTRAGPSCIYSTTAKPNADFQQTSNRRSRCRRTRTDHAGGRCGAGSCVHPKHQIPRLRARRAGRTKILQRSPWRRCGTHSSPACPARSPALVRRQNNHPPYISIVQQHFAASAPAAPYAEQPPLGAPTPASSPTVSIRQEQLQSTVPPRLGGHAAGVVRQAAQPSKAQCISEGGGGVAYVHSSALGKQDARAAPASQRPYGRQRRGALVEPCGTRSRSTQAQICAYG